MLDIWRNNCFPDPYF